MLDTLITFSLRTAAEMARNDGFHKLADALLDLDLGLLEIDMGNRFRCSCEICSGDDAKTS